VIEYHVPKLSHVDARTKENLVVVLKQYGLNTVAVSG
jgi:hypothetical protein